MAQKVKGYKGCCIMCAAPKIRGNGQAKRRPWSDLRQLGVKRRLDRHA